MKPPAMPLAERLELAAQACRAAHLLSCEQTCLEAKEQLGRTKAELEERTRERDNLRLSATPCAPIGYAVQMQDGPFVGIWRTKEEAENIRAKQPPSHHDRVIPLYSIEGAQDETGGQT